MPKKTKLHNALQKQQQAQKKAEHEAELQNRPAKKSKIDKGKQKAVEEQPAKKWLPFEEMQRILLVGEANFAFALSLLSHHIPSAGPNLIATSFDSLETCKAKYTDAEENINQLRDLGATVLFDVDAGALESVKAIKGKVFDRIVFNYPHVGLGEKDEARNIRFNQALCLRFFRSAAPFLELGAMPRSVTSGQKRKRVEGLDSDEEELVSQDDRGSILITLRDAKPYSEWNIPSLAKKGPLFVKTLLPQLKAEPDTQPTYVVVRSGPFDASFYPGYAHRRTIGYKSGTSFDDSADTKYSAKERRKEVKSQEAGVSKMWQLCRAEQPIVVKTGWASRE